MYIQANNLTYSYQDNKKKHQFKALNDVSFTIEKGSWTALIGPTGSGKSTFAQLLNGLLKPESGKILINGVDIASRQMNSLELKRRVGLVFQYPEHQIFEALVYDEVAYGPRNLGLDEGQVDTAVRRALQLVGLNFEAFSNRAPLELSGGEKRKVAIAGVLAMNPEIIVFDEATAALDPASRRRLLTEVEELRHKAKITVLWITHNLSEVLEWADQVVVFNRGRIAAQGEPDKVFTKVELLEEINLGVPQLIELQYKLLGKGLPLCRKFTSLEDTAEAITKLLRRVKN